MGFAEGSTNCLMAVVLMAPVLANISSLEKISSPDLKHKSVIKHRKNKHPFGLNVQVEISLYTNCQCLLAYHLECNGVKLTFPCLLFQYV